MAEHNAKVVCPRCGQNQDLADATKLSKILGAEKRQFGKTSSEFHSQRVLPYRVQASIQKSASLGQLQAHKMTIWTSPVDVLPLGAGPRTIWTRIFRATHSERLNCETRFPNSGRSCEHCRTMSERAIVWQGSALRPDYSASAWLSG
jgi:hypothetical protein